MAEESKCSDITDPERRISQALIGLVDIIFAVSVGNSINPLILHNDFIKEWPVFNNILTLSNFALLTSYIAIFYSWIGYHRMVEKFPYRILKLGKIRLFIAILIVILRIPINP